MSISTLVQIKNPVQFKIDTGSAVNILLFSHFTSLNVKFPLEASPHKLTSYTGDTIPVKGMVKLACCHKESKLQTTFYIVDSCATPLIGLQSSRDLGLIKLNYSVEERLHH